MKRYCIPIAFVLSFLLMPYLAHAKVYTFPYFACVQTVISGSTFEQQGYIVSDINEGMLPLFDPPDTTITRAAVGWKAQPDDKLEIRWYDWQGKKTGTTNIDFGNDPSLTIVKPPARSYAGKLVLTTGKSSGGRYFYWVRVRNSKNNDAVFQAIGL